MAFEPIKRVLPKALEQAGIKRQIDAVRVLEVARSSLEAVWGADKAALVIFISFSGGTLKAQSSVPAAVQELKLIDTRLRNEINRSLGSLTVKALSVRHG